MVWATSAVVELNSDWLNRFWSATVRLIVFTKINKMGSKIGFEMSLIIVEAIRGRCASFMSLPATVSEIFGGQTTPSILVV